jgi:hypothetical protein
LMSIISSVFCHRLGDLKSCPKSSICMLIRRRRTRMCFSLRDEGGSRYESELHTLS